MTNTAQEIREAFIQIEGQPERLTINNDHPRASDAHRMIDALGDRYGKQLSVLEWCYIAVPECLEHIAESSPDNQNPQAIRDNASDAGEYLASDFMNELRAWVYEHPVAFEEELDCHADEYGDEWPVDEFTGGNSYFWLLRNMQSQAYAAAFDTIADQWPEPEEITHCPECGRVYDNESEYCPECDA